MHNVHALTIAERFQRRLNLIAAVFSADSKLHNFQAKENNNYKSNNGTMTTTFSSLLRSMSENALNIYLVLAIITNNYNYSCYRSYQVVVVAKQ